MSEFTTKHPPNVMVCRENSLSRWRSTVESLRVYDDDSGKMLQVQVGEDVFHFRLSQEASEYLAGLLTAPPGALKTEVREDWIKDNLLPTLNEALSDGPLDS
jgi:hypothetical protein